MKNTSFYGNSFGDALKWALDRSGISQSKLAKLLNVSRSQVSNIVNGHFSPSEKKIREIELALGEMFKFLPEMVGYSVKQVDDKRYSRVESAVLSAEKSDKGIRAFSEGYSEMLHILNLMIYNVNSYPSPAINNDVVAGLHTMRYLLDSLHNDYIKRGVILYANDDKTD